MKIDTPWVMRLGGFGLTRLMRSWMGTLKYQVHREEPAIDPVNDGFEGPNI